MEKCSINFNLEGFEKTISKLPLNNIGSFIIPAPNNMSLVYEIRLKSGSRVCSLKSTIEIKNETGGDINILLRNPENSLIDLNSIISNETKFVVPLNFVNDQIFFTPNFQEFNSGNPFDLGNLKDGLYSVWCDSCLSGVPTKFFSLEIVEFKDTLFTNKSTYVLILRPQVYLENLLPRKFDYSIISKEYPNLIIEKGTLERGERVPLTNCSLINELHISISMDRFPNCVMQAFNYKKGIQPPETINLVDENDYILKLSISHDNICGNSKVFSFYTNCWIRNETQMNLFLLERKLYFNSSSNSDKLNDLQMINRTSCLLSGQNVKSISSKFEPENYNSWFDEKLHSNTDVLFNKESRFQFQVWDSFASKKLRVSDVNKIPIQEITLERPNGGQFNLLETTFFFFFFFFVFKNYFIFLKKIDLWNLTSHQINFGGQL